MLQEPDTDGRRFPLPIFTSYMAGHSPQADATKHHGPKILKGWLPHLHVIMEDMPFEEKQTLGKHMDLFHRPNGDVADRA